MTPEEMTNEQLDAARYDLMRDRDKVVEQLHMVTAERNKREAYVRVTDAAQGLPEDQRNSIIRALGIDSTVRVGGVS